MSSGFILAGSAFFFSLWDWIIFDIFCCLFDADWGSRLTDEDEDDEDVELDDVRAREKMLWCFYFENAFSGAIFFLTIGGRKRKRNFDGIL